jgi:glycosyltransferase involved in cell wall biosynthesis
MLRSYGHDVDLWELDNAGISGSKIVSTAINSVWSQTSAKALEERLLADRFDILHVQNFFPQFSPVVHRIARKHRVASVQHLRNYRYTCVNASLYRSNAPCFECVGSTIPWKGVARSCYRDSMIGSAVVATMLGVHKALGTWTKCVSRYIAISDFVKEIHVRAGLPAEKISVRSNIVPARDSAIQSTSERRDVVVISRLVPEKGIATAIAAWKQVQSDGHHLRIIGSGPQENELRSLAEEDPKIIFMGQIRSEQVREEMKRARLTIVPSLWAEPFGRTALESMAVGTPVLASRVGGLPDVIGRHNADCLFDAGDQVDLASKLQPLLSSTLAWHQVMDQQQERYARLYSQERLYRETLDIYQSCYAEVVR